ncbi:MAG: hypothetical protein ACTHMR_22185 [Thermomicrobiales bacterium]
MNGARKRSLVIGILAVTLGTTAATATIGQADAPPNSAARVTQVTQYRLSPPNEGDPGAVATIGIEKQAYRVSPPNEDDPAGP